MKFLEWIIAAPISLLLLLKTYQLSVAVRWVWEYGSSYTEDLLPAVEKWRRHGFNIEELKCIMKVHHRTWALEEWPVTRWFLRFPDRLEKLMINVVFRLPTLIFLQAGVLFYAANTIILSVGVTLLWIALWVEILHILSNRLILGHIDGYFKRTVSWKMLPHQYPQANELNPSRRKLVREFTTLFAWLLGLIIIGYAGIYAGLDALSKGAFNGLNAGWTRPMDLFYFSVVTLATVGYGDMSPHPDAILVRLAVASQILSGVSLTVFLLTSFSLTIDPE